MKKIYLSLLFAVVTMFATAQSYQLKVLDFEGDEWSALIDNPQYGGPLLYGDGYGFDNEDDAYTWYDEGNTYLKSTINNAYGSWCYWSGGVAVSNYYDEIEDGSYTNQLSINYNKDGNHGHNNSANFATCFGYNDGSAFSTDSRPVISFGDGVARVIDHMYVINTTYILNAMANGSGFNPAATDNTYIDLIAEGFDTNGESTGTTKIRIQDGTTSITEWTKFDLSSLGAIVTLKLNYEVSNDQLNDYGFAFPGYIAVDDIAVRIPLAPATFEDITIESTESFYADKTQIGINPWNSYDYTLDTYYTDSWGDYYADYVVSNCTATDGTSYDKPYQSTAGGAKNGNNYAVFYADYYNTVDGAIYLATPSRVSGFWACNTTYVAYCIKNWDGQSSDQKPFGQGDYFKLIITGYDINGEKIGSVEQMLIDCTDANEWHYIKDWRWVDLTSLGNNVMYVKFAFEGTKQNAWGLTTPTYVCIDDFGGDTPTKNTPYEVIEQPTAIDNVAAAKANNAVRKVVKNGRLVIAKDGKFFNASGAEIK